MLCQSVASTPLHLPLHPNWTKPELQWHVPPREDGPQAPGRCQGNYGGMCSDRSGMVFSAHYHTRLLLLVRITVAALLAYLLSKRRHGSDKVLAERLLSCQQNQGTRGCRRACQGIEGHAKVGLCEGHGWWRHTTRSATSRSTLSGRSEHREVCELIP